jgi:hypothetical protein
MTLVPLITGSDMAPPGMTAAPVQDRRQRIASLKDELQRLEQELVREDEVRAVQAAEEIQAQRDRVTVQGFLREHTDDTKSQPSSPPSLHDLHETLRQQQAAIDRLTRVLEALQSKLQGGAAGAGGGSADESTPDSGSAGGAAANPIDRLIELRLREAPEANVDDATFLRRLMLDVTGTVPTAEDVKRFLEDPSPDKRQRAIDELLRRSR